ncbi:cytochrome d ubiquinol oxidase subunit II, partial [Xanthomonas citri pv. citri]|nr:cytochrome d ubiquinol oxidase subunit II [Xanthomonas citri pv. citri]
VTTSFWGLFTPFALIGGILFVVLFCAHGANFVALKTMGDMHDRARKTSAKLGWIATVVALVWALMFNIMYVTRDGRQVFTWILCLLVVVLLAAGSTVVA